MGRVVGPILDPVEERGLDRHWGGHVADLPPARAAELWGRRVCEEGKGGEGLH